MNDWYFYELQFCLLWYYKDEDELFWLNLTMSE